MTDEKYWVKKREWKADFSFINFSYLTKAENEIMLLGYFKNLRTLASSRLTVKISKEDFLQALNTNQENLSNDEALYNKIDDFIQLHSKAFYKNSHRQQSPYCMNWEPKENFVHSYTDKLSINIPYWYIAKQFSQPIALPPVN